MTVTARIWIVIVSSPVTPALAQLLYIPHGSLVIVKAAPPSGASAWRCISCMPHLLQPSPLTICGWGAVVVARHNPSWKIGEVVDVNLNQQT